MATPPNAPARTAGTNPLAAAWNNARAWLEQERIGDKSVLWFISGWRLGLIVLVLAIIFPQEVDDSFVLTGIGIGVYVMLALGLNIVVGYAGLLDLGYVAFFIIGNYAYAAFSTGLLDNAQRQPVTAPILSFWFLIPLGIVLAGVIGVLLGAPTLRLRGDYLAIVTLGFGEIARITVLNIPFFGGANGLNPNPAPRVNLPVFGEINFGNFVDHTAFYYLTLAAVTVVVIVVSLLRNSSMGRAWVAMREDETAAAASGVNLVRTKLLAFGTGAAIGGLGGVFSAAAVPSVNPSQFSFLVSITILVMVVLGGISSIPGVIIGATLLRVFDLQILSNVNNFVQGLPLTASGEPLNFLAKIDFNQEKDLFYGIVLVAMILLRPQGILPDRRRQRELRSSVADERVSSVGALAIEEAGGALSGEGAAYPSEYAGPGSDAQGREE